MFMQGFFMPPYACAPYRLTTEFFMPPTRQHSYRQHALIFYLWLRRESNPDLEFRKPLFYPLNYGALRFGVAKVAFLQKSA
jgi:hypothetical protein